ncbi:hypothetical protein PspLS_04888 [Pyricularia sp. CBS 133598]|nr:hypothetical protein PspLS_04888 [Pyricularia sp. CBS 133598]
MTVRQLGSRAMSSMASKKVPIPRRGVDYRGKVVLAPMVRSSEMPSRLMALHYGADLVWGPETVDYSMIGTTRRLNPETKVLQWTRQQNNGQKQAPPDAKENAMFTMHPELEGKRLIFQLGSGDPQRAVAAASLVANDVAGIDLNAGCPKPFSTTGGMGAALLRDPDRLVAILEALVREVAPAAEIGISVKIRLLETAAETEALVRRLVKTGITALTVHCRTTPMRPREPAIRGQLRMVADVCREAGVACLMNGDVKDRDEAIRLAAEYGTDGAMIARAAEENPSCFRAGADGGLAPWTETVPMFMRFCLDMENKFSNTKYLLNNMIPGKAPEFRPTQQGKTFVAVCEALNLDDLVEQAKALDDKLGLTERLEKSKPAAALEQKKGGRWHQKVEMEKQKQNNPAALASGGNMSKARDASAKPRKPLSERGVGSRQEESPITKAPALEPAMLSS